jgi:plastocyanin
MGAGPRLSRRALLATSATLLVGSAGCTSLGTTRSEGEYDIGMDAIDFLPERFTVTPGTEVVWRNTNTRTHTVTAYEGTLPDGAEYFASGGFESQAAAVDAYNNALEGGIVTEETYTHTFEIPGEYGYFCIPHRDAQMNGIIEVAADTAEE